MRENAGAGTGILRPRCEPELIRNAVEQFIEALPAERIQHHAVHDQITSPQDVTRVESLLVAAIDDRNRSTDVLHPRHQLGAENETDRRRRGAPLESVTEAQGQLPEGMPFLVSPDECAEYQTVVCERQR